MTITAPLTQISRTVHDKAIGATCRWEAHQHAGQKRADLPLANDCPLPALVVPAGEFFCPERCRAKQRLTTGHVCGDTPRARDSCSCRAEQQQVDLGADYRPRTARGMAITIDAQLIARDVFGSTPKDHTSKAGHEAPNIVTPIPSDDLSF
jgi:hypothetical protein